MGHLVRTAVSPGIEPPEERTARGKRPEGTITLGASTDLVSRAAALGARDARLGAVAAPTLPPPVRSADEVREELGIAAGRPLVLSVGRLHPQKGYDVLVAAASRWRSRRPVRWCSSCIRRCR